MARTSASKENSSSLAASNTPPRRLILPMQAKGTIGKSTVMSLIAEYLEQIDEDWRGFDLDDRNHDFARTFESTGKTKVVPLAKEEHLDNVVKILSLGLTSNVTLLDPQAFTDHLIRDAFRMTRFLDQAPDLGIRPTILIFPFQENTVMREIVETFEFVNNRADFIIVYNKTKQTEIKTQFQMFFNSPLEKTFLDNGAKRVFMPFLIERIRLRHRDLVNRSGKGLRYAEFVKNLDLPVDTLMRAAMEDWLKQAFWEFDDAAEFLTSTEGYAKAQARRARSNKPDKLVRDDEVTTSETSTTVFSLNNSFDGETI